MSSVKDFQSFMINDSQLKSTGKILSQANLFALNGDKSGQGKPNRLALVLVSDSEKNRIYIIDSVEYKKCIIASEGALKVKILTVSKIIIRPVKS